MTSISFLIIVIIVIAGFYGWRTGLIAQLGRVVGFCAALLACHVFGDLVVDLLNTRLEPSSPNVFESYLLNAVIGYVLTFAVVYFVVSFLSRGLRNVAHHLMLGFLDRLAGVVFTILEWMVGVSLLLNVWVALYPRSGIAEGTDGMTAFTLNLGPALTGSQTVRESYRAAKEWQPVENKTAADSVLTKENAKDEFIPEGTTERMVVDLIDNE